MQRDFRRSYINERQDSNVSGLSPGNLRQENDFPIPGSPPHGRGGLDQQMGNTGDAQHQRAEANDHDDDYNDEDANNGQSRSNKVRFCQIFNRLSLKVDI